MAQRKVGVATDRQNRENTSVVFGEPHQHKGLGARRCTIPTQFDDKVSRPGESTETTAQHRSRMARNHPIGRAERSLELVEIASRRVITTNVGGTATAKQ